MSYNEDEAQRKTFRHLFLPGLLGFSLEVMIASFLLLFLNLNMVEYRYLHSNAAGTDLGSYIDQLFSQALVFIGQSSIVEQAMLFIFWITVGMLVYVFFYRLAQLMFGALSSINEGFVYVRAEHRLGLLRWLETLHNFFIKIIGGLCIAIGMFLTFAFASQQLQQGFQISWPHYIIPFSLSIVAAIIGVRIAVIGICLFTPRFARWYLA